MPLLSIGCRREPLASGKENPRRGGNAEGRRAGHRQPFLDAREGERPCLASARRRVAMMQRRREAPALEVPHEGMLRGPYGSIL